MNREQLQWVYDTIDKAIMLDNYVLVCEQCPDKDNIPCREAFCSEVKRELMIMIKNVGKTEKL